MYDLFGNDFPQLLHELSLIYFFDSVFLIPAARFLKLRPMDISCDLGNSFLQDAVLCIVGHSFTGIPGLYHLDTSDTVLPVFIKIPLDSVKCPLGCKIPPG